MTDVLDITVEAYTHPTKGVGFFKEPLSGEWKRVSVNDESDA